SCERVSDVEKRRPAPTYYQTRANELAPVRRGPTMPSITPFLWYDTQAEEAMNYYASIFKRSKIISVNKIGGRTIGVEFELEGQRFMALNGGPKYKFNESYSMFVSCDTQAEIDDIWEKLTANGGGPTRCGWLQDKYGLSWQIIPKNL